MSTLATKFDARRAANFRDAIGRPCAQCVVATLANPTAACRYFRADGPPCIVARGRYRRTLRSALPVVRDRPYLEPSVDRYAMLCGVSEQLKVERAGLLCAGKAADEIDDKLTTLHREASRAMREAGLAAHVGGVKEDAFDRELFATT